MPKKSRRVFLLFLPLSSCALLGQALVNAVASPEKEEERCVAYLKGSGSVFQGWEYPSPAVR